MIQKRSWLRARKQFQQPRIENRLCGELLEQRELLAGDLVAQWTAESLNGTVADAGVVTRWLDGVQQIEARADGQPRLIQNAINGRSALRFDASDGADLLIVPSASNPMSNIQSFTVAVAFATDSTSLIGGNGPWFQNTGLVDANTLGFGNGWGISINASGQVGAGIENGFNNTSTVYATQPAVNDGELHTVFFRRSANELGLVVDDSTLATRNDASTLPRGSIDMAIGGLLSRNGAFSGDIAEVRLYNGALTDAEIANVRAQLDSFYRNSAPIPVDDQYVTQEDNQFLLVPAPGVLANDLDADGDMLTAELVQTTSNGTLFLRANGEVFYTPRADFFGTDTFTYRVKDFRNSESIATVNIIVEPRYDPAVAVADSYKLRPDEVLNISSTVGVLANDTNIDRAPLKAVLATNVSAGSLQLNEDGSFRYDPQGFSGTATFTYQVDDQTRLSPPATVTFVVNTPPQAQPDMFTTPEDVTLVREAVVGVLANDTDADGNPLRAEVIDQPTLGIVLMNEVGAFTYIPNENVFGTDQFTYRVFDGVDWSGPAVVTIQVQPVNDAPKAEPDFYFTLSGQSLDVAAERGLLANDSDIEGDTLRAERVQNPTNGTLQLNANGSFTYTPNAGFQGTDQFTYRASDLVNASQPVTVTLTVTDRPVIISELMASNSGTISTILRRDPTANFEGESHTPDWIELQNLLDVPVDLGGMYLTDDLTEPEKWQFPPGTVVAPSAYLLVFASGFDIKDPELDQRGALHTNFSLTTDGEQLALISADGNIVDTFGDGFPLQRTDISFGLTDQGAPQYFLNPTPGAANAVSGLSGILGAPGLSSSRDFYDAPFQLEITSPQAQATIRYTTDGSLPTLENGTTYSGPLTINRTTTVRARVFQDGLVPSTTSTHSYFFLSDVVEQDAAATRDAGFPASWRGNAPDYGFDSDDQLPLIAGDANMSLESAKQVLQDALLAIPTLSIVMNVEEMFGTQGIYANPTSSGPNWERATSVEWLNPDGTEGFQIDAGIRIQGGAFRSFGLTPKKSFRLLFKTAYGPGKLNYPIFGEGAATEFDTLTLRMDSNDGWQWGDAQGQPQYARDEFLRRTQLAMGQPAPHGRNVHLYINGFYWGMYNVVERPDESFGAAYFGSYPYDWDGQNSGSPINADGDRFRSSRSTRAWNDLIGLTRAVRSADTEEARLAAYMRAQGLNPDGTDDPELPKYLDPINYADYLIANYYGGNNDWPFKNYYFGRENSPDSDGFKFFMWDAEWSLLLRSNNSISLINNASNVARPFQDLRASAEFRLLFADRVHKHLFNGGALYVDPQNPSWDPENPERNVPAAQYAEVAGEIYEALIAESARWGDQHRARPYTRDVEWQREYNRLMRDWFPSRSQQLLQLFRQANLYPSLAAPLYSQRGGEIQPGQTVTLQNGDGSIYYTINGKDPRQVGGEVSADAQLYTGPFSVEDGTTVTLRGFLNGEWSAIDEATFYFPSVPASADSLRVSELHYNPGPVTPAEMAAGFEDKDDFEFIELVNISSQVLDLTNVELRQETTNNETTGLGFRFADGAITRLAPGQRVVLVENLDAFRFRYGEDLPVAGQWTGGLSNAGESVRFFNGDALMYQVQYSDDWHPSTDGQGFSLEVLDAAAANLDLWNQAGHWRPSSQIGGTPGTGPTTNVAGDSNRDGRFNSSDLVAVFQAGKYENGIPDSATFEEGDWNGDGVFSSRDLVFAFQQGNYVAALLADELLDDLIR